EHHCAGAGVDRHQDPAVAAAIGELHRMGDVADADVTLLRGDDLARLHAAAALDQLGVQAGLLEIADAVGNKMGLLDRHGHRIDSAALHRLGAHAAGSKRGACACNNCQCGTSADIGHHAFSFSVAATRSRAFNTTSPISTVESFFAPGSAISAVRAPDESAVATAFSSRSASSGRFIVNRSIIATLRMEPSGLAMPLPAISGALPCTG